MVRWLVFTVLLVGLIGCRAPRKRRPPPRKQPVAIPVSDPCASKDRAHKWNYYPDEKIYFCDRHAHHWVRRQGHWIHRHKLVRPNYGPIPLINQSEFRIFERFHRHRNRFPPGTRRR